MTHPHRAASCTDGPRRRSCGRARVISARDKSRRTSAGDWRCASGGAPRRAWLAPILDTRQFLWSSTRRANARLWGHGNAQYCCTFAPPVPRARGVAEAGGIAHFGRNVIRSRTHMPRCLARYIQQARAVFAREALPLSPPQPPPTRRGFASLLLSLEPLPLEPEAARSDRPRLLTLLFAPERLPQYPESPRAPQIGRAHV